MVVASFNHFERIGWFALAAIRAAEGIMAGKDIRVKKYVVRLSAEEREQLQALVRLRRDGF